jgi:hypothetical protein
MMQSIPPLVETALGVSYVRHESEQWRPQAKDGIEDERAEDRRVQTVTIARRWWLVLVGNAFTPGIKIGRL